MLNILRVTYFYGVNYCGDMCQNVIDVSAP